MGAVTIDGLRVGSREVGDGPAVVLLHGYVGDGGATWHPQLSAVGDEFRLVALDVPGAGASADPSESFGMNGYADCLAGFIAGLGVAGPHLVDTLLPTMFATMPAADDVDRFEAAVRAFRPGGFRAMARASAEDLRELLADIDVPTLLVYGDQDVRAPLPVAEHLLAAIAASELTVLPGLGHVCNLEHPDRFNDILRTWLRRHR